MYWSFSFFFTYIYIIFVISLILYLLPVLTEIINYSNYKTIKNFEYVTGNNIYWLLLTPLFLQFLINFSWISFSISAWFGHLIFSAFQHKLAYLIIFIFYLILTLYASIFYFSSKVAYDFIIVCFNFFLWIILLFCSNTFFSVIFFIEIISTLVFLLLIASTFTSVDFYNNLNLNINNYFHQTTPFFYVQTLLFFFWISLISSLNLFFFLILFYLKFLTFDWFFFEYIFYYLITIENFKNLFSIFFIWFNLIFSIFLKCGLVPFYFWKPIFFKGLPLHAILFYILFFYFFIFLFFINFLLIYLNEIFYSYIYLNLLLLMIGFIILLSIICEAYYIKTFLAISSIINTLFIFLTLSSTNINDFYFYF